MTLRRPRPGSGYPPDRPPANRLPPQSPPPHRHQPDRPVPPQRPAPGGRHFRWWPVEAVAAALALAAGAGFAIHAITTHSQVPRQTAQDGYRIGACVQLKPSPSGELHAANTSCDTDPSFVVSTFADTAGHCNPDRFDRFGPPFADAQTGTLCLEPNLVAGHCYRFGTPVGMWEPADCAQPGPAVIKVTKRVDVDDDNACPNSQGQLAMPYPSPPRTYCTAPAQ
jgi:hypothetical protein